MFAFCPLFLLLLFSLTVQAINYEASTLTISPEEELCGFLMTHCPYLRAKNARPVENSNEVVVLNINWELQRFLEINDLRQTFSFAGALRMKWQMPPCARWFNRTFYGYNLSSNAGTTSFCQYSTASEIWSPSIFVINALNSMNIISE